ncbi:MetQ/NlpA family ABC transporter substrate-binding protein [Bacillus sp. V59.32b]|uniref:MetQ/NlpA family ABC transporter substrate-binding protein n=1 Tax=Bacillus sp. V59.32b TaxID=1758642 RepID=UPI000E3CD705|nr:MetQ/NlpA family ABC transporter substrate-binding protein [Bacillus sp. V59.32b]RFU67231.1 MetQ/NlpA family ABC transporter substrate-binding protein [Bacillus sp. V59.32b]
MKKWLKTMAASTALVLSLAACGTDEGGGASESKPKTEDKKIVVGASNIPHAEILEKAKPILKEEGVELEIQVFSDYILPNRALEDKEIDANYFQHIPYMELQMKEEGYKFANAGGIHIEPIGIYSKKHKSLEDIPEGGTIIMRDSVADHGRILMIFQEKGLIKLKDGIDKTSATIDDIVENPKKLKFKPDVEAGLLPQIYNNDEGDAVVINANYALDAGLDPVNDPIAVESKKDNPYVNVITVREGDEDRAEIKKLVEVLKSKEIQDYINEQYKGAVVPAE